MPNSEPFRNLPPIVNMDATVDSSPPPAPSDGGVNETKTPLLIRTHLPSSAVEAFGMIGGYQLVEKLGEGGMGTVYKAEDVNLKRHIALKVMKPNVANEPISRERFFREARAAAQLEHDNIVAIFRVDEENGVPFLAMPLLKGESLASYLQKMRRPDIGFILKCGRDVALGLAAAHGQGLIHRDIKPDNIWIEPPVAGEAGGSFRAKILDFGLARPRQEDGALLTRQGAFLGTPAYVAPEQARGQEVDNRADLFSLGCVLYEMTAGRRPFSGVDTLAVLTSLISDRPEEPRIISPDVPPALSMLIMQLLEKDPTRRPASATIVADLLKQIQGAIDSGAPPNSIGRYVEPEINWQRQEPRSMLPFVLLGILVLFGAVFYALYKYTPPPGPSTVEILAEGDADLKYGNSNGLKIIDTGNGKTIPKLNSNRKFKLEVGSYRAEIDKAPLPGLLLKNEDVGADSPPQKVISFEVKPGVDVKLRVIAASTTVEKDKK